MGFFDRVRNFIQNVVNRSAQNNVPDNVFEVMGTPSPKTEQPNLFQRAKNMFSNLFGNLNPSASQLPYTGRGVEEINLNPFNENLSETDIERRKQSIFEFRRNTEETRHLFYRLTQSIWDRPGVSASRRDEAIQKYYKENYGISDMNAIYDKVLSENAELVQRYIDSPNAMKYEVVKNIKVKSL